MYEQLFGDKRRQFVHPTDPSRNLADDIEKKIAQHMKKEQAKNGGSLNKREIARTISSLKKEYGIKMRRGLDMETMTTKFMDQLNSQKMRFKRKTKAEKKEMIVARKARKEERLKRSSKFEASYDDDQERLE